MRLNTTLPTQEPQILGHALYPWVPDMGDGTYRNPVLQADYSDPDIVRCGSDFYMVASSFQCTPGLPILHSRDLVNWTLINHALLQVPHPRYAEFQSGQGVWAPSIRYHAGQFWIFFPLPDEGIYLTIASDPSGTWSAPLLVQAGNGLIDPCPLWDDDSKAYLVYAYAHSRAGVKDVLRVSPMAPDGTQLLGDGHVVFAESARHPTIEGPKFLKRNGWYYIFAPAGGVDTGWQAVLRSRHIYGPYEDRVVLEQGCTDINGPHQGAMVETQAGDWWFFHFQDAGVYGRIGHLQPVKWVDDWPCIGQDYDGNGIGEPVSHWLKPETGHNMPISIPPTTDTFATSQLGLQWQWNANNKTDWCSLSARPGYLRLFSQRFPDGGMQDIPNLLLQKFPARAFAVHTILELAANRIGETAGVIVMGYQHAALCLSQTPEGYEIRLIVNNKTTHDQKIMSSTVRMRIEVVDGGICEFYYAEPSGKYYPIGAPFQASKGQWLGARIGLFAVTLLADSPAGHADFCGFTFSPVVVETT